MESWPYDTDTRELYRRDGGEHCPNFHHFVAPVLTVAGFRAARATRR